MSFTRGFFRGGSSLRQGFLFNNPIKVPNSFSICQDCNLQIWFDISFYWATLNKTKSFVICQVCNFLCTLLQNMWHYSFQTFLMILYILWHMKLIKTITWIICVKTLYYEFNRNIIIKLKYHFVSIWDLSNSENDWIPWKYI